MEPNDTSAWLTAAIITLIVAPFLMSLIPRCNHQVCRETHKEEQAKELRALVVAERERLHAFHSWDRPQKGCPLCSETCPVCKARGGCTPDCSCRDCV